MSGSRAAVDLAQVAQAQGVVVHGLEPVAVARDNPKSSRGILGPAPWAKGENAYEPLSGSRDSYQRAVRPAYEPADNDTIRRMMAPSGNGDIGGQVCDLPPQPLP